MPAKELYKEAYNGPDGMVTDLYSPITMAHTLSAKPKLRELSKGLGSLDGNRSNMFKLYLKIPARPARNSRESYGNQVERPTTCDGFFVFLGKAVIGSQVED